MSTQPNTQEGSHGVPAVQAGRKKQLGDLLLERGIITPEQLAEGEAERQRSGRWLGRALVRLGFVKAEELANLLSSSLGRRFVDLAEYPIDPTAAALLPEPVARRLQAIPIGFEEDELLVAVANQMDVVALDDIRFRTGRDVRPVAAAPEAIKAAIRRFAHAGESVQAAVVEAASSTEDEEATLPLASAVDDGPLVRMVDTLIARAIADRASDIHIEPGEKDVAIRYRVDGVLHDVTTSPRNVLEGMVARLKIMANLNIAEKRRPQDGRREIKETGCRILPNVAVIEVEQKLLPQTD